MAVLSQLPLCENSEISVISGLFTSRLLPSFQKQTLLNDFKLCCFSAQMILCKNLCVEV